MVSGEVRAGAAAVLEALTQPEQGRKKVAEAVAKDAADVLPLLLDLASQPAGSPRRFPGLQTDNQIQSGKNRVQ